jgi:hypothetical protein
MSCWLIHASKDGFLNNDRSMCSSHMKRAYVIFFIILFVTASIFVVTQPSQGQLGEATENFMWGVEYNPFRKHASPERDLDIISNSSVQWIRVVFRWRVVEPAKNIYDFTFYDNFVETAANKSVKILGVVGSGYDFEIPDWVKTEASTSFGIDNPNYVTYWKDYVRKTVERYDTIEYWQVENELNHIAAEQRIGDFGSFRRNGDWNSDKIQEILTEGAKIVKSFTGRKVIINVEVDNPSYFFFARNITDVWEVDYDILGLDFYAFLIEASDPTSGNNIEFYIDNSRQFKEDIIICETGYTTWTANHTLEKQAEFIEITARKAYEKNVLGYFVYKFHDTAKANEKATPEPYYGLLTNTKGFKPAWYQYQQIITESKTSSPNTQIRTSVFGGPVVFLVVGVVVILIGAFIWKRRR